MHCILKLVVDQVSREVVLQLKNAPGFAGRDVPSTGTNQSEIGDDGYPDGFLNAVDRFGDKKLLFEGFSVAGVVDTVKAIFVPISW